MFNKKVILFVSKKRVRIIPKVPKKLTKDEYTKEDIQRIFGITPYEYYKWKRNQILLMKRKTLPRGGIQYTISKKDLKEFIKNHIFEASLKLVIKEK